MHRSMQTSLLRAEASCTDLREHFRIALRYKHTRTEDSDRSMRLFAAPLSVNKNGSRRILISLGCVKLVLGQFPFPDWGRALLAAKRNHMVRSPDHPTDKFGSKRSTRHHEVTMASAHRCPQAGSRSCCASPETGRPMEARAAR